MAISFPQIRGSILSLSNLELWQGLSPPRLDNACSSLSFSGNLSLRLLFCEKSCSQTHDTFACAVGSERIATQCKARVTRTQPVVCNVTGPLAADAAAGAPPRQCTHLPSTGASIPALHYPPIHPRGRRVYPSTGGGAFIYPRSLRHQVWLD